jgi:hypothetical protein
MIDERPGVCLRCVCIAIAAVTAGATSSHASTTAAADVLRYGGNRFFSRAVGTDLTIHGIISSKAARP